MKRKRLWNATRLLLPLLTLALLLTPLSIPTTRIVQAEPGENGDRLEQLAALSGRPAGDLVLVDVAPLTLLDGRELERVKAIDLQTGDVVGAVFEGDRVVDEAQARAAAGAWWRAEYGALTPNAMTHLAQLQPGERVNLALWLAVELQDLPRPEAAPRHRAGPTAQGGAPAAPLPGTDEKVPATPLTPEEIPPDLLALLNGRRSTAVTPPYDGKPEAVVQAAESAPVDVSDTASTRAAIDAYRARNDALIRAQPYASHPTAVAGIIRSTHPTERGLAPGVTVYSANGSYSDWGVMSDAIDWGCTQAEILNNSWYWDSSNNPQFWAADRQLDYVVRWQGDFVTVAAGNFGNGCGSNFSSYVVSPAKGYNVLSVGNYDDQDSLTWTDDVMNTCSSFGDPGSDSASPTHEKPEIAAVGTAINSTLVELDPDDAVGPVGSGTSYSSPMVAALAANLIQADSGLVTYPEAVKAVIMAAALHNIEGSTRLSDVDGVGGMVASAAMASVERGHWDGTFLDNSSTFPIQYTQYAHEGERVRFVITWDSNPTSDYTSDPLPADLDLRAYRADGTTLIAYSTSGSNNFEIVDFIAPASETYRFSVSLFGSWSGGGTYMGVGWWRGTYRISRGVGYSDPVATPLGTHLSVYPEDWPNPIYWRTMGVRSVSSDHDLRLYSASWFDDPATRSFLAGSYSMFSADYVVVDGNHRSQTLPEHYRVSRFSGSGGYDVGWSSPGIALYGPGLYGPYSLSSDQVLQVFDVFFASGDARRFTVFPTSSSADLGMELFRSNSGDPSTWAQGQGHGVARADAYGVGVDPEQLSYLHPLGLSNDWLGLVVYNNANSSAGFYILVEKEEVYLPVVLK